MRGLSLVAASLVPLVASCCGAQVLGACGLRSWGAWAYLLRSIWDLPGSGTELESPAQQVGSLPLNPQGSPLVVLWKVLVVFNLS